MGNKRVKYTYTGMQQDTSKAKHSPTKYFDAQHIRLLSTDTQATGAITNEKGNELVITIPTVTIDTNNKRIVYSPLDTETAYLNYTTNEIGQQIEDGLLPLTSSSQKLIGSTYTRQGVILFTTDEAMDCIWFVENLLSEDYSIRLLYVRNLKFSINNPIQALFNYENEIIEKVYWVDGESQLRFLNINHSIENESLEELIDISSNTINFVGNFDLVSPVVTNVVQGGNHTSGMIQYAYNLYRLNGSQTTLSPITDLIPLANGDGLGGGGLNEIVGATPIIEVSNIDSEYTHIKLYAIKYTSFNFDPTVSIIANREIGASNKITYFDDGAVVEDITLEEFLFLGSNPIIPKHITSKDSRLFMANIKENAFDVDLDCRAFGFDISSTDAVVLNNTGFESGGQLQINPISLPQPIPELTGAITYINNTFSNVGITDDAVNPNYDGYRYKKNSTITGGTGKYIEYSIDPTSLAGDELTDNRFFKNNEIYRIGIQFYNRLGQVSFPKWIADFKAGNNNLDTTLRNTLQINLTAEFQTWLDDDNNFESEDDKPTGYTIIRAERNLLDRTILYQGVLSPMMFQVKGSAANEQDDFNSMINRIGAQDTFESVKIPSWAMRNFHTTMSLQASVLTDANSTYGRLSGADHLAWLNHAIDLDDANGIDSVEIHSVGDNGTRLSQTFLYTKMMQLFSPELMFEFGNTKAGLNLRVVGLLEKSEEFIQIRETDITTALEKNGGTVEFYPTPQVIINNNVSDAFRTPFGVSPRYIGPSGDDSTVDIMQMYREYSTFHKNNDSTIYSIYGTPEINEVGSGEKAYNGDPKLKYTNTLTSFISDDENDCDACSPIASLNARASKNLTMVLGTPSEETQDRDGLEDLFNNATSATEHSVALAEVIIPEIQIYSGNIYGGNSYEDKKRNTYSQIGEYRDITTAEVAPLQINSPGDTFIGEFKFMRIGKSDSSILNIQVPQITEIVSIPIETTVDLKNRSDLSIFEWNNTFQPTNTEYTKYNTVYSQTSNILINTGEGAFFNEINQFDTRVYTSKLKLPGEFIDSWTDLLINESTDLDGKYGPINNLINFNDILYTFQDEAIAQLSINPNIIIQGSDSVSIELGTGDIFHDYNYITTTSGSINKWGIMPTERGIYYYDALNKGVGRVPDMTSIFLSDVKGMHTFFNNNFDYNSLKIDNPLLGTGVIFGYDNYNNDIYITALQGDLSFTRIFNESVDEFIDKKLYYPSGYIYKGEKLLLYNSDSTKLYEQFKGEYNTYFDEHYSSYIILMLNPDSDYDCVFDNIQYNSELYLNDIDQPDKTLTHIRAYSEYQDSGSIPLIVGRDKNLRRKFRTWKADIPREGRNRIRNPWIFLKLELDTESNAKFILHDIIVDYTI